MVEIEIPFGELYNEIRLLRREINDLRNEKGNHIQIADFMITSSTESLKVCEQTINRLVDRNLKFSQERAKVLIKTGSSCYAG